MADIDSSTSSELVLTSSPILEWYSKLYSRRVDIVGDYAGNELFLIEGDSVLLDCFSDYQLDFDPGFQLLHASYAVESFLQGLVARRCNFHIAFFDEHYQLCVPLGVTNDNRAKYLLARAAIIRHLRVNLKSIYSSIEVHVFPSLRSASFAKYIEATDLYFIMTHDGASSSVLRKRNILSRHLDAIEDEDREVKQNALMMKTMFRHLIHWFLSQGYNAALVNGLEWRDTKVMTTVLESNRSTRPDQFVNMVTLSLIQLLLQLATNQAFL